MQDVVEAVVHGFSQGLGDQLQAIYLFGSLAQDRYQPGQSDANLLMVVADGVDMHAIRELFLPLWREYGARIRRAPMIAQANAFARHMSLNPVLAAHLSSEAKLLVGEPALADFPTAGPQEEFARLAYEAMHASACLAPDMLEPDVAASCLKKLRSLTRKVTGATVSEDASPAELLAKIQQYLSEVMADSPHIDRWISPKRPSTSLLLPSLEGAYKELGQLVMSFSVLTPDQIKNTDWENLSAQLAKHYTGLKVVTSTQLRLIVQLETPLAFSFQRFEHEWGVDVLYDIEVNRGMVMRNAARLPSAILVDSLPHAYLTEKAEAMGDLIHDFQNRMLNIQLEHELLRRLQEIKQFEPAEPLPGRDAPQKERIEAIFQHLDWWAGYYADLMSSDG